MKTMIKRLVCLIRGHEWEHIRPNYWFAVKCKRCGVVKNTCEL